MNGNDHIPEPRALFHRFLFESSSFSLSCDDLELQVFNQGIAENRFVWACICDPSKHVTAALRSTLPSPKCDRKLHEVNEGLWCSVSRVLINFDSEAAKSIRVQYCILVATAALSRFQDISGRSFIPSGSRSAAVDADKQGSDMSDWIYRPLLWDYIDVNFNEVMREIWG